MVKKKKSPKLFVVGILIVVVGLLCVYFYKTEFIVKKNNNTTKNFSTPTEVSPSVVYSIKDDVEPNWKDYTNTTYGYTLKYPAMLHFVPQDEYNQHVFGITNSPHGTDLYAREEDEPYYEINVMVSDADGLTLPDIAKRLDGYASRTDYSREDYVLDGVTGYKATDIALDSLTNGVMVIHNGKEYFIGFRYFKTPKPEGEAIYQEVLNSFRFLK